jgi:hypothetical protein
VTRIVSNRETSSIRTGGRERKYSRPYVVDTLVSRTKVTIPFNYWLNVSYS